MRHILLPVAAVTFLSMCSPAPDRASGTGAVSQASPTTTDTTMATDTAAPAPSAVADTSGMAGNLDDSQILAQLDVANSAEIQGFQLAAKQAQSPKLKQLATKIAADHEANRKQGRQLAQKLNAKPSASELEMAAQQQAEDMKTFSDKQGKEFDQAFVDYQIEQHQKVLDNLQNKFLPAAQSPQLKTLIQNTIPKIKEHEQSLKQLQDQMQSTS